MATNVATLDIADRHYSWFQSLKSQNP